ncbi:MAG TPA: hypothetical protein VKE40_02525, partial [Gemmataceae bacterium]|nr:hypothetical protein [Gemmataceae bacterium]
IDQATALGRRAEAIQAFAQIFEFLTQEPRDWGDPIRHYRVEIDPHGRHWNSGASIQFTTGYPLSS